MNLEQLRTIVTYKDGNFYWENPTGKRVRKGDLVGSTRKDGSINVVILGKNYLLHRLVWFFHHGYFPKYLDHINGDRKDNRIENLRVATLRENQFNRKSSKNSSSCYKGVFWFKRCKRWGAKIQYEDHNKYLGSFESEYEAALAYDAAAKIYHGEFYKPNLKEKEC